MQRRKATDEGAGVAGAIAATLLFGMLLLPAVLAPVLYMFFTVTGMIHGSNFRASTINLPILFVGLVVIATMLVVLLLLAVGRIGRSLTPRKRPRRQP